MWSMIEVDEQLIKYKYNSCVIGQIHDSIMIDVYPGEEKEIVNIVKGVMVTKANKFFSFLKIPLKIDIEIGKNWSVLKKLS